MSRASPGTRPNCSGTSEGHRAHGRHIRGNYRCGNLPAVALAAVIAREHPKWGERPVLIVEPQRNQVLNEPLILAALRGKVPDWWLPDQIVFIERMPLAATGKIDKRRLRDSVTAPP